MGKAGFYPAETRRLWKAAVRKKKKKKKNLVQSQLICPACLPPEGKQPQRSGEEQQQTNIFQPKVCQADLRGRRGEAGIGDGMPAASSTARMRSTAVCHRPERSMAVTAMQTIKPMLVKVSAWLKKPEAASLPTHQTRIGARGSTASSPLSQSGAPAKKSTARAAANQAINLRSTSQVFGPADRVRSRPKTSAYPIQLADQTGQARARPQPGHPTPAARR